MWLTGDSNATQNNQVVVVNRVVIGLDMDIQRKEKNQRVEFTSIKLIVGYD